MREIFLTQNKVALVDDWHYERLAQYKWNYNKGYAVRCGSLFRMASEVLQTNEKVDHRNHNSLDNQEHNLRLCTHAQNQHNSTKHKKTSSIYKGVSFVKARKKWQAYIYLRNNSNRSVRIHLGYFFIEEEAARVYDAFARLHFKEFAALNFPREGEQSCLAPR